MSDTRLFYVVDSVESNEELFETYQSAREYMQRLEDDNQELVRLRICEVNNAYKEQAKDSVTGGIWNYDDRSDTFTTVKEFNFEEE